MRRDLAQAASQRFEVVAVDVARPELCHLRRKQLDVAPGGQTGNFEAFWMSTNDVERLAADRPCRSQ